MVEGTVQVSTLVTIVVGILSIAGGIYSVLIRFSFETYQKANEKRFLDLEKAKDESEKDLQKEAREKTEKVHELELVTTKLEGEVRRLGDSHDTIQTNMVLRSEWEPRQERIEKQMDEILQELRGKGRYSSAGSSTPRFPAVHVPQFEKKEGR